jgi:hypothetical protein
MSTIQANAILDASGGNTTTINGVTPNTDTVRGRNLIINGDMRIDQRNGGAAVSSANGYIVDRWTLAKYGPGGGAYSGQQVSDAPDDFDHSLKVTVTTSTAGTVNDYWQAFQTIEGFNSKHLKWGTSAAKTVTVSFWVKSSVTGTYSFAFYNNGFNSGNRALATTYTINSANTWEYKTLTISGDGTAGASYWGTTNTQGVGCYWDLGCGDNQNIPADTWTSSNARRVAGTVKLINTANATWQITGVKLEVGSVATEFDHRSYGEELALCQRYFERFDYDNTQFVAIGSTNSATTANAMLSYSEKRDDPTITLPPSGTSGGALSYLTSTGGYPSTTGTNSIQLASRTLARIHGSGYVGLNAGTPSGLFTSGASSILIDAEL